MMRIDLRKQLHAYGEEIAVVGNKKNCVAVGIFCRNSDKKRDEAAGPEVEKRSIYNPQEYNLWMALCDPCDKGQVVETVRAHGKTYQKVSGCYDKTFCCYRLLVREVGS